MTIKELQEEFDALNEDVVRDWIKRNGIPAPDPDSDTSSRAKEEPVVQQAKEAQGESEELDELKQIVSDICCSTDTDGHPTCRPEKLCVDCEEDLKRLLQWRTKSLLALIGEDEVDPNEGTAFYSGVMVERNKLRAVLRAALQDIKKKVEL